MATRTRSFVTSHIVGNTTVTRGGVVLQDLTHERTGTSVCRDAVGRSLDHDLDITRIEWKGSIINYQTGVNTVTKIVNKPAGISIGHLPFLPTQSNLITRLLASTGPLTPKVNLPLFLFELKDIPRMLKHAGDYLHKLRKRPLGTAFNDKEAASWTLAFQFGWKPLIEDIGKLLNFAELVSKRQTELKKAASSKGLKRRITLHEEDKTYTTNLTLSSSTLFVTAPCQVTQTYKAWGTLRWKLKPGQTGNMNDPSFRDAFKSALGLNLGMIPITVWKALPWSWMVDWFANLSNSLQASYNMLYYTPSNACIMHHKVTTLSHPLVPSPEEPWISQGDHKRESKVRVVTSKPTSSFTLKAPFLDAFKLSILGSLAILRIRGR